MKKILALIGFAGLGLAASASADLLHDNGPWVTGIGDGNAGANTSSIEQPTYNSFGYNANNAAAAPGPFRVADDFTVGGGGWNLTNMTLYAYQTGSTTAPSINGAVVAIYDTDPSLGGLPVQGDTTTNRINAGTTVWTGVYRVTTTTLTGTTRPVMSVDIDMNWVPDLAPGHYWVAVGLTGSLASGPWVVPTTPANQQTDNAIQFANAAWAFIDGNGTAEGAPRQDLAFQLQGTVVPEPTSLIGLGLGLAALAMRRR